jgi:hypothetical protein
MIFSLAIANDAPEAHRKKAGDIIAIRPADWQWGRKERQQYLIVKVDVGPTFDLVPEKWRMAAVRKLECPLYDDGSAWHPGADEPQPGRLAKNRYQVPFTTLDGLAKAKGITVDWKRVRDEADDYQPLEGTTLPLANLITNKASGLKLTAADLAILRDYDG